MRNLLVVVDMQNDFIDGSLGTKEAVTIVDNVIAEIAKYDAKDIFATRDTHPENYLETQEGKNLPVVHCVKGTDGWQINEKVKTALKDAVVIDKPTFGSKILAEEITKIAEKEDINVATVRKVFKRAEKCIFAYLSSTTPTDNTVVKILDGLSLECKYIPEKEIHTYDNIQCESKIWTKPKITRYYNRKLNGYFD